MYSLLSKFDKEKMQLLEKFRKILYVGLRATLNFRINVTTKAKILMRW